MRLTELDPRWLTFEGQRRGLTFWCPCCAGTDKATRLTCFFYPTSIFGSGSAFFREHPDEMFSPESQAGMVHAALDGAPDARQFVPCNKANGWNVSPPVEEATFDNMSVTPSLDASPSGHWHGFITNGEVR